MNEDEIDPVKKEYLPESGQGEIAEGCNDAAAVIGDLLYSKYAHSPPDALQSFCFVGGTPSSEHDIDFCFEKEEATHEGYRITYQVNFEEIVLTGCPDQPMLSSRQGNLVVIYNETTHEISFEAEEDKMPKDYFRDEYGT